MSAPGRTRLPSDERRQSIVVAAVPLFAAKGFNGTTTRELAEAAGVSEALLYKHFPSKETLYLEMQHACFEGHGNNDALLDALPRNTEGLVLATWLGVCEILATAFRQRSTREKQFPRLMINSLLEDGEFARLFLQRNCQNWHQAMRECLLAAQAAGDLQIGEAETARIGPWLVHHMSVTVLLMNLPVEPVVDYGADSRSFTEQAAAFALRGLGLPGPRVRELLDPPRLEARLAELGSQTGQPPQPTAP